MFTWLTGSSTTPPALLSVRSSKAFIIATVALAVFTDLFLYGVVVPVLPFALHDRAGVDEDDVETWVSALLAVYGGSLLIASPVCGWYADRSPNRRWPLLLGLVALAGATAILAVGNSIGILIVGRILQGFSAGVVWVVGLALVSDTVGLEGIGEAMGYVGIGMTLGVLLSPLVGGVVFDKAGYEMTFLVSFLLLGVDIVLRLALVEKKIAERWTKNGDAVEMDSGVAADSSDRVTGVSPTTAIEINADMPVVGRRSRLPTLLVLLKSRRLCCACFSCLIVAVITTSFDSTLTIFVEDTFGWDSLGAGLCYLPLALPSFGAPLIGAIADRYGPRYPITLGFLFTAPVIILMRLVESDTIRQKVLLFALLTLTGVGLSAGITPIMAEITYSTEATIQKKPAGFLGDKGAIAQAYGLFNMAFAAGSMAGPLLGGLVAEDYGWPVATLVLGLLSGIWAIPAWYWTGGSIVRQRKKADQAVQEDEAMSVRDV